MLAAVCRFDLRIRAVRSLKEKRHVVKSLTGSLRARFNVSVAEVDHHDLWQRAAIGVSVVTADLRRAVAYYTVLGEERDHKRTRAGLRSAAPRLRAVLGHSVRLKFTPELEFREDLGQVNLDRVAGLLREVEGHVPGRTEGS